VPECHVLIVHLRRPDRSRPDEKRTDPFWEFGSFGITTCHARNLLKPGNVKRLKGVRFAFAQGGKNEMKLVLLTPPIRRIVEYKDRSEVLWDRRFPFKFRNAPLLIDTDGKSDFPSLKNHLKGVRRSTWVARFSSKFRSRTTYLDPEFANEIMAVFDAKYKKATREDLATLYEDALPYPPHCIDTNREKTYERCQKGAVRKGSGCGVRRRL